MTDIDVAIQKLVDILRALDVVLALPDFIGKDDVDEKLRWAAQNYAKKIYKQSVIDN